MQENIGIYGIMCQVNNMIHGIYIGQSMHITKRWLAHSSHLKNGSHPNSLMQQLYNLYGDKAFQFVILELCSKEELNKCEVKWYEKMKTIYPLYNLRTLSSNYALPEPIESIKMDDTLFGLDSVARDILSFYQSGTMPSYRTIARRNKVSKTVIANRIRLLRDKGLMK